MTKASTVGPCVSSTFATRMLVSIYLRMAARHSVHVTLTSGKGFDYHYHGDPYGDDGNTFFETCACLLPPVSRLAGKCMYSASSYASTSSHPPLIGYGLDGFPIYGRFGLFISAAIPHPQLQPACLQSPTPYIQFKSLAAFS